ncbi:unnamed protein product, partial [Closterium sp. NIES-53]
MGVLLDVARSTWQGACALAQGASGSICPVYPTHPCFHLFISSSPHPPPSMPVARALNSLPRIRMGVLLDVARSVRASAGGMGAWSMRDLTHGLYLLSLQHAEERAVDTVASNPVIDEQT